VPEAQSTGIANVATEFAVQWAIDSGFKEMELWTWEISHQSRRFYEKVGFTETSDRGISGYAGIRTEDDITVRYNKMLRP
jgi:GNAT superfamily N-acetyltransferase